MTAGQRQPDTAGIQVGENELNGLFGTQTGRVEPQANPVGLLPQHGLQLFD
jgi:hypothetical protein